MPGEAIVPLRWLVPWGLRGARPGRLVKYDPFGHTHDTYMYMVGSNGLVPFGDCFVVCLVGVLKSTTHAFTDLSFPGVITSLWTRP